MNIHLYYNFVRFCLNISDDRTQLERSAWVNTTQEGIDFVRKHPEYFEEYQKFQYQDRLAEENINARVSDTVTFFQFQQNVTLCY